MDSQNICAECGAGISKLETCHISESSPVHPSLAGNLPLSTDEEKNAAREALRDIQQDLVDLDEEISRMRIAFRRLLSKRNALRDYADAHKGLISSWRRIPNEILSEIFQYTLPAFPFQLSEDESPLVLQRVCRRWKDVSRSTPVLWSQICIDLDETEVDKQIEYASTCLARSGKWPLTISLASDYPDDIQESEHQVLEMLASQSERWHTLHLQLPSRVIAELRGLKGRLSSLRDLDIFTTHSRWDNPDTPFDAFASAPRLRHLTARSSRLRDVVMDGWIMVPWKDLTSLVLDMHLPRNIWRILQCCTCLVEFEAIIPRNTVPEDDALHLPRVTLAYLRSLSLSIPESSDILSALILPSLERVNLSLTTTKRPPYGPEPWHVRSGFIALLSQSRCTLLKLGLQDNIGILADGDFFPCLEAIPSLVEVNLCPDLTIMLVENFAGRENNRTAAHAVFLPRLRKITLSQLEYHLSWDLLWEFLEVRREGRDQLETLQSLQVVVGDTGWEVCALTGGLERLCALRDGGMYVEILDKEGDVRWL